MGNECKALAQELLKQPELLAGVFLESANRILPEHETLVGAAKQYTGQRSTTDDARLLMVGALRVLGATDREIERTCGVTRRSIKPMMEELELSGRVTPLKDRLTKLVGDNAERSSLLLRDLMEKALDGACDMDLAAMLKAAGQVNSFQIEKFQLLTGGATEIVETRVAAGREEFERWWKESAIQITQPDRAIDSKSIVNEQKPNDSHVLRALDTSPLPPSAVPPPGTPPPGGGSDAGARWN